jgi:protein ATS1
MPFRVSAFGSNASGQLGIGHSEDTSEPQPCKFHSVRADADDVKEEGEVAQIVAGGNHTLMLTSTGRVWAAGRNDDGRAGLPNTLKQVDALNRIDLDMVTSLAATWQASMFVLDRRKLLSCGTGLKGELGQGPDVTRSLRPSEVNLADAVFDEGVEITDLAAGINHVVAITAGGELFGWGNTRKGQLGDEAKIEKVLWKPQKIKLPFKALKVVAGRDFTFVVGRNSEHLLLGDSKLFVEGVHLARQGEAGDLRCGWSNIYQHSPLALRGVGRAERGQLPPNSLPALKYFAAGSEHCLASTTDGQIVAWGWGEHGNCGSPVDERGCVANRFNTIAVPIEDGESIQTVAAGCATSFVVVSEA